MAYHAITEENEIAAAQEQFFIALIKNAKKYEDQTVGFRGGNDNLDLFWHLEYKFWYGYKKLYNRHWNIFGTDRLERSCLNIGCEINFPYMGHSNRVQGIFVRDETSPNRIIVAHQGRLTITDLEGEGNKFLEWVRTTYPDRQIFADIYWDDAKSETTEALIVAALDDPIFLRSVKDFVVKAVNFKNIKKGVRIVKRQ